VIDARHAMNNNSPEQGGTATVASEPAAVGAATNQSVLAQQRLRELILAGELAPGLRLLEVTLAERLGVSRTPVRTALVRLEQEGLLDSLPAGGYRVRQFSEHDLRDAIELRGTVEGLAARLAAERGVAPAQLAQAREHLRAIDVALAAPTLGVAEFAVYAEMNEAFHAALGDLAGSGFIRRELERARSLPFAAPSAFLGVQLTHSGGRQQLVVAQDQHHQVLDAIERREGARAEALMREHARIARRNLDGAAAGAPPSAPPPSTWSLVPGGRLVVRGNNSAPGA
jgi:GntR family transcriptional regulator of vanillate catabolism